MSGKNKQSQSAACSKALYEEKNNYNQIPADSKEFLEKNENKVKVLLAPKPISVKKAIHYSQTPASW